MCKYTDIVNHFAGSGIHWFDMIDLFAHPAAELVADCNFITITEPNSHIMVDAPRALAADVFPSLLRQEGPQKNRHVATEHTSKRSKANPPVPLAVQPVHHNDTEEPGPKELPPVREFLKKGTAVRLAMAAFLKCDRTVGLAYVQGRAFAHNASDVHRSLAVQLKPLAETPYTLAIALRAMRPDIQQFVAHATYRLVTMAPNYDQINRLFEECIATPLCFTLHSAAWEQCNHAYRDLGCSGIAVKHGRRAAIVLDGIGIAMPRRDLILLVLALLFRRNTTNNLGTTLTEIVTKYPWLTENRCSTPSWWMTPP